MKGKNGLTAKEALDLIDDDLPDGAYFAMGAEMYGEDYGDFMSALGDESLKGNAASDPDTKTGEE
jgi:hypothetical protein